MSDPTPEVKLPDAEYVEILNRSTEPLPVGGIRLCIGSHQCVLPDSVILPSQYALVCDRDSKTFYQGNIIAVESLPPVLNTGQVITLLAPSGKVIHTVTFSPGWYEPGTEQGGYSLEMIDPDNPCTGMENWTSSHDSRGGTPGAVNSVLRKNPDTKSPYLVRCTLPNDSSVLLHFSEPLNPCNNSETGNFSLDNGFFHPGVVRLMPPQNKEICLSWPGSFKPGVIYSISVADGIGDCANNVSEKPGFSEFGIAENPHISDIVFNEVLFDVLDDEPEFIELYNRSTRITDMKCLEIALTDYASGDPGKKISLFDYPFLLLPGHYVVLTKDAASLLSHHPQTRLQDVIQISNLFTLNDREGGLVVLDSSENIIDEFRYSDQLHHALIHETAGLSVERVSPDKPSTDPGNWMTSSTLSGYSTPGYVNSVSMNTAKWEMTCSSENISPDNDGVDDVLTIHLQSDHPGIIGSLSVYTLKGELVCQVLKRSLTGTDEYLEWNGKNGRGETIDAGLYVIYGEFSDDKGNSKIFKKVISVVKK